jgi:hypothetical protein
MVITSWPTPSAPSACFRFARSIAGGEIEALIGSPWKEGKDQLGCVLPGNHKRSGKESYVPVVQILQYLKEFAVPCAIESVSTYLASRVPDHIEVAKRILNLKAVESRQDAPPMGMKS